MPEETRVFDVARPGHSSPDANSKPVIVGHHPTLSDPMVKDSDPGDFGTESSPTRIMVHDQTHTPSPAEDTNAPAIIETPETEWSQPEAQPAAADPAETPPAEPLPAPVEDHPFVAQPESEIPAITDETTTEHDSAEPAPYEALPSEPLAHVEGLHVAEPKRRSPLKAILLILLVLLVAGYLAVDSGAIKTSLKLPFHVFKQKTATPPVATPAPTTANNQAATSAVPAGFTVYKLAGTTITFAAPTAWGQPTSTTDPGYSSRSATSQSDAVYAYLVSFATNKDVQIAVTSSKSLPPTRTVLFYDYLQWCTGTSDSKIYLAVLHSTTANKVDTPTTVACDQGPLADATKLDSVTIVQLNAKDASGAAMGDVYTKNLTKSDLPVFRVKDAAMASSVDIKKLLLTVKE